MPQNGREMDTRALFVRHIPKVLLRFLPTNLATNVSSNLSGENQTLTGGQHQGTPVLDPVVTEKEYYTALEHYLSSLQPAAGEKHWPLQPTTFAATKDHMPRAAAATSQEDQVELENYHLQRMLCGAWLFDHDAHSRYSYYPSNTLPLGSIDEHTFFMRAFSRSVNNPYVDRLYKRGGDFDIVLKQVPASVCPCIFLMAFNVQDRDVWQPPPQTDCDAADGRGLSRLSVENELLFKSDFFNRTKDKKAVFTYTNRWVYDTFLRPYHCGAAASCALKEGDLFVTASGHGVTLTEQWFHHKALEARINRHQPNAKDAVCAGRPAGVETTDRRKTICHADRGAQSPVCRKKTVSATVGQAVPPDDVGNVENVGARSLPTSSTDERRTRMRDILTSLYFGQRYVEQDTSDDTHARLLARCEDHRSYLYSPLLKVSACKHEDEEISFVQRRSGDEIATELRKCKACGRVKAM